MSAPVAAMKTLKIVTVAMSGMEVSRDTSAQLVTYSLGSCIAVCLHDPIRRVAGMIHFMLPLSKSSPRAKDTPGMFGDIGVPLLFRKMYDEGCAKNNLIVKIIGGGVMLDAEGVFNVGPRNVALVAKLLQKNKVRVAAEDTGGSKSRTVRMPVGTGRIVIMSGGKESEL